MTASQAGELSLAWLALAATLTAVLSRRASRRGWAGAALLLSGWLAISESPALGSALAVATVAGLVLEGDPPLSAPDFARVTRRLGLLAVAVVAAVVVLARFAQVEASQAPYAFPLVALGMVSLIALFAASEPAEAQRAARLLLAVAVAAWTVATGGSQPAVALAAAAALPTLAVAFNPAAGHEVRQ
ncbi:MAG TPA: hypothetical protein VNV65_00800 [Candidatus Solibacter sp.]|jgi:hypothetical protein|nr:hypothetical protein [Candidatus Solibacter sp.]